MKRFFDIADGFVPIYGGAYTVRPSYYHVECVFQTQVGLSMKVPEGADVAVYAAEINKRLAVRSPGAGVNP